MISTPRKAGFASLMNLAEGLCRFVQDARGNDVIGVACVGGIARNCGLASALPQPYFAFQRVAVVDVH